MKWLFILLTLRVCAATYFVNPATGSDGNSGLTPALSWKTAGNLNGFSFAAGDIVVIDTTAALFDLWSTNLVISSHGLTIKATNAPYWTNQLWQPLTNAHFTASGPANVYQIPLFNNIGFTQQYVVLWESDAPVLKDKSHGRWMAHPTGSTFASVSNHLATNSGSFWTDGAVMYVHPFDNTNPANDGKYYLRSVARAVAPITINATNVFISGAHAGGTCLARDTDNDGIGAYVMGTLGGFDSGSTVVSNCYMYYGSKHVSGFTSDANNSELLVIDTVHEQASAYGSSSAWVSYMASATATNNTHRYIRCRTDAAIGLVGSTLGQQTVQSVMLSHNNGSGVQFQTLMFSNCNINGYVGMGVCSNAILVDSVVGGFQPNAVVSNICERNLFTGIGLDLGYNGASNTLVRNNIFVHTNNLQGGVWTGELLMGRNLLIENNTFNFGGVTSSVPGQTTGLLKRQGDMGLVFRNNAVLMGTNVYYVFQSFTALDTLAISNNFFQVTRTNLSALYTNGGVGVYYGFGQWQALGFDANSVTNAVSGMRANYQPNVGAPVNGFGVNIGPMADFSGTLFSSRTTAGAYEYAPPGVRVSGGVGISGGVVLR